MTRHEHLLTIAMEECNEVAQRISKAKRFGMAEVQPGQPWTNKERIIAEFHDLVAVLVMADVLYVNHEGRLDIDAVLQGEKERKVEKYLAYSVQCGTVDDSSASPSAAVSGGSQKRQ